MHNPPIFHGLHALFTRYLLVIYRILSPEGWHVFDNSKYINHTVRSLIFPSKVHVRTASHN